MEVQTTMGSVPFLYFRATFTACMGWSQRNEGRFMQLAGVGDGSVGAVEVIPSVLLDEMGLNEMENVAKNRRRCPWNHWLQGLLHFFLA